MVERIGARQRVIAADAAAIGIVVPFALGIFLDRTGHDCAVYLRQFAHVRLEPAHAVCQCAQHVIRGAFVVGFFQIGKRSLAVARAAHRAVGADRQAARHGGFLEDQRRCARVGGVDCGNCSGVAESGHDDIVDFVEFHVDFKL
jgi:hypothetical protein